MNIFIDSNYFIGLYNPGDSLHEKAKQIAKQLQKDNPYTFISNFIFLETVTVLSQRLGKEYALSAGNKLLQSHSLIVINARFQNRSWEIFKKTERKNVSFVDCSTLAIMEFENITSLLSFDKTDFKPLQKFHKFTFYNDE